jgi:hypothetical protein
MESDNPDAVVEHSLGKGEVVSSILTGSTIKYSNINSLIDAKYQTVTSALSSKARLSDKSRYLARYLK